MLKILISLYKLLSFEQRSSLHKLQFLVIAGSIAEVASVLSVGAFIAIIGDTTQISSDGAAQFLYLKLGFTNTDSFIIFLALSTLIFLLFTTVLSIYALWRLSMYGARVGADLSNRLFIYYMGQPWLFHASNNSSSLINKIATESARITAGIISHVMLVNSKLIMTFLMCLAICLYDIWMAISAALIFSISYTIIYKVVQVRLRANGQIISKMQSQRFKLMNEGFGGIKDTLLLGRAELFNSRFSSASIEYARVTGGNSVLSLGPRYIMELAAFTLVILFIVYLIFYYDGNLSDTLPLLSIFALAGFKLLPGFQQIYYSYSTIRGNIAALENLHDDLKASSHLSASDIDISYNLNREKLSVFEEIRLENIHFQYPNTSESTLEGVSLSIPAGKVIGLVGSSGSGKSTIVDIILGLIEPSKGKLFVDQNLLSNTNKRFWQNNLGFVAQRIFLSDATIKENIAFGLSQDHIDETRVYNAAKLAQLDELANSLPDGLDTIVGERGIQLSGGQCQRIGIARALYHNAEVLIMDEATSSLDGISEKLIMKSIHELAGNKTIILIAHRLNTVKECDIIYILENGKVVGEGSYQELSQSNELFKKMTETS